MSYKISELPVLESNALLSGNIALVPIVSDNTGANVTYNTDLANIKTFISNGNLNLTGSLNANLLSNFVDVLVTGNLSVLGTTITTASENLSTNASLIDLHTFDSNLNPWTSDDGRDIGLRFFYYKTSAQSAALVWENSSTYLTYYASGVSNTNTGMISGTLGTMQLGEIKLANTTPTTSNSTGSLTNEGGISSKGNLWVDGLSTFRDTITATTIDSNASITVSANATIGTRTTTSTLQVNNSATVGTTLTVQANATIANLYVNSAAYFGSTGYFGANLNLNGNLNTKSILPITANTYNIGSSGSWYNTVYATAAQTYYADLAEIYKSDVDYEPGTVVIFGGDYEITVTNEISDTRVAGVISTDPAYLMNMKAPGLPVALRGKVPVKIIGPVAKGDLLTTSNEYGYAISTKNLAQDAYSPNAVFAKSVESDSNIERRKVWAVIL